MQSDTSGLVKFVIAIKKFILHFIKILNYIGKVNCLDPQKLLMELTSSFFA